MLPVRASRTIQARRGVPFTSRPAAPRPRALGRLKARKIHKLAEGTVSQESLEPCDLVFDVSPGGFRPPGIRVEPEVPGPVLEGSALLEGTGIRPDRGGA